MRLESWDEAAKRAGAALISLLLAGCSSDRDAPTPKSLPAAAPKAVEAPPRFGVENPVVESLKTAEEINRQDFKKWIVDVQLRNKVGIEELKSIALTVKEHGRIAYDLTAVHFYLPYATAKKVPWASVTFDPAMNAAIHGLSIEEERKLREWLAVNYADTPAAVAWLLDRDRELVIISPDRGELYLDVIGPEGPRFTRRAKPEMAAGGMRFIGGERYDTIYEAAEDGTLREYRDGRLVELAKALTRSDHAPK